MNIQEKKRWFAIVNPFSGKRKALSEWPRISKFLREAKIEFDFAFTEKKYHATELTVYAVKEGYTKLIVIGGDGTFHEVVNGLYIQTEQRVEDIIIGIIPTGKNGRWTYNLGISSSYKEAVNAIKLGKTICQNVGVVKYTEASVSHTRYIINFSNIGFKGYINCFYTRLVEKGYKGKILYFISLLNAIIFYKSKKCTISFRESNNKENVIELSLYNATMEINRYDKEGILKDFKNRLTDSSWGITIIKKVSPWDILFNLEKLFNGKIHTHPKASHYNAESVIINSSKEVFLEADGERLGVSPFKFSILKSQLNIIVNEELN